jgi:succinate-semialdehyde dehydrogenase/glutarate-semialdehyde dehydrogenase
MTTEFRSFDPSTGRLVTERPAATPAEIEAALNRSWTAFEGWSRAPVSERAAGLRRLAAALATDRERLAALMAEEIGKPIRQGRAEIEKCAWACTFAADSAEEWLAPELVETEARRSLVRYEPLGPILAIMPWNFPFWQVLRFGAGALAAGDTIVLKHAPNAPRCAEAVEGLFVAADLADRLVNVYAHVDSVEAILADRRIAGVTLTGSTRAGRLVAQMAARHLKPSVLELGGSDAFVVLADADLDAAAEVAASARLQNNGQSCIAAKRFIVEAPVADAFLERFRARLEAAVPGDPRDDATILGPMARRDLRDGLHGQVAASVRLGARCLLGGAVPERDGFWYPATLLTDVSPDLPVWEEETFGPVAAARVARDAEEAVALANHHRYGLGATLFTRDLDRAEQLGSRIRSGSVFVNGLVRSDPRLPFGGVGESGWGRELGRVGMRSFTLQKTVWVS